MADLAIQKLRGVDDAMVTVTFESETRCPLARRSQVNDGFGWGDPSSFELQRELQWQAFLQAEYQRQTSGRGAVDQEVKLKKDDRTAASYDFILDDEVEARYVYDEKAHLTMVISSLQLRAIDAIEVARMAIDECNSGEEPGRIRLAAEVVNACLNETEGRLPEGRVAVAMIGSASHFPNKENRFNSGPIVICSQARGAVVEPRNYIIVASKAMAVAKSGRPSSAADYVLYSHISRIPGGVAVEVDGYGQRVLALGGLMPGSEDVAAINRAIDRCDVPVRRIEELD